MKVLRAILAVVVGLAASMLTITLVEGANSKWFPPPEGIDLMGDPDAFKAFVATLLVTALLVVIAGWAAGTTVGCLAARAIAPMYRGRVCGVVGGLMLAATVTNLLLIPHPTWFAVAGVLAVVGATVIVARGGNTHAAA
jgi:hypothetical protein